MSAGSYRPQLDGLRAVAIAMVVAYHLGYLRGGWIGVDLFFVLSGYLITSILLHQPDHGINRLGRFWARRLLPAVLLVLSVVLVYGWAGGPGVVPAQLRAPALATVFYGANWQQIIAGHSYFASFRAPNPFQHTWSLAIEEQYYLVWPLLLGLLGRLSRSRPGRPRPAVLVVVGVLAVVSMAWMGAAAHLFGANRAYLGTDTRAWELLGGGLLAMIWPAYEEGTGGRAWAFLAPLGLAGVVAGAVVAGGPPAWVWDGGLVAIAACGGLAIVGSVRHPAGLLGRLLASGPLRWLGLVSYSLYLWHWPVIVLMTPDNTGLGGAALLTVRVVAMLAAAGLSYYLVESPLRRMDWAGLGRRLRVPAFSFWSAGLIGATILTVAATVGPPRAGTGQLALSAATNRPSPHPQAGLGPVVLASGPAADPYRVWLFGDSVMKDASPGIRAALDATGRVTVVANTSFGGWGTSTDRAWPGDVLPTVARTHPQIAIGTWSWDDTQAQQDPSGYTARLESALRTLTGPRFGIQLVVLVQFPQPGPVNAVADPAARYAGWAQQTSVQDAWDAAARRAAAAFPGRALYVTTDQLFAPGGRFYTWFPTTGGAWVRARKLDNAHFCPLGAAEFGRLLTNDLSELFHLPGPVPGWQYGSWTRDPRYNDPPGACPADHPPPGYRGLAVPPG